MVIPGIVFVLVAGIVFGAYWALVLRDEDKAHAALKRRLKAEETAQARLRLVREPDKYSSIVVLDRLLKRYSQALAPLKQAIDDSGLPLTVSKLMLVCALTTLVVAMVVNFYTRIWWLAIIAGVGAVFVPTYILAVARERRMRVFEQQFPEAVDLIARALRAGHAFSTGVQMVAEEMPKPSGPEFRLLYDRQNYGAQLPDALRSFAERVPSLDARFFVTAVLTQREAGGNLSEVLDRLAAVMRERFRIKREVRVKSAHGRITALVLAGMPPVLATMMFVRDPSQVRLMLSDPLGIRMLILGGVLELIGVLVIRRLVEVEY